MMAAGLSQNEMEVMGYERVYDYTQYSHDNDVNVIPESSFKRLIQDTFRTITDVLRETYGPYGSTMVISDQNETMTTKDGYNVFESMFFSHHYKRLVYLAIKKICERVNRTVGDGTTSCILLADKMFRNINELVKTPDDKRNILKVLSEIEKNLTDAEQLESDMDDVDGIIEHLDIFSFDNVIKLASNYDEELTNVIVKAMDPQRTEYAGFITDIRNVIVETNVDKANESAVTYTIDYLPGDYRVRVNMDVEFALSLSDKTDIKIALFDHTFTASDWATFMSEYDNESKVMILATAFNRSFMDNEYTRYLRGRMMTKSPVNLILVEIKGSFVRDEISDLAALLNVEPFKLHSNTPVNHNELPIVCIQVYKGNCLCFHNMTSPKEYIKKIEEDMKADQSGSYITRKNYMDRIKALSMNTQDTLVTINTGTMLEAKMLSDKIDDCVSIINSAFRHGVVPNMLRYGHHRMHKMIAKDDLSYSVIEGIKSSIEGLFEDVWRSKYNFTEETKMEETKKEFYSKWASYDIINNGYKSVKELPTSAQYDLEVIVAAISIVKYLLTSRGFIFDAHLMTPTGDRGHYQQMG